MCKNAELKIRYKGDKSKWEIIPVCYKGKAADVNKMVYTVILLTAVQEIRWNFVGSAQGHYVFGTYAEF